MRTLSRFAFRCRLWNTIQWTNTPTVQSITLWGSAAVEVDDVHCLQAAKGVAAAEHEKQRDSFKTCSGQQDDFLSYADSQDMRLLVLLLLFSCFIFFFGCLHRFHWNGDLRNCFASMILDVSGRKLDCSALWTKLWRPTKRLLTP